MNERDDADRPQARDTARAAQTIRGQLQERDVRLHGDESPEQLADLLDGVQRFEAAVAAYGGDSMTNAPDSRYPDDRRLVLPARRDDESVTRYLARVNAATEAIRRAT